MRICHSFWTKPIINNRDHSAKNNIFQSNIWLYTLSVAYARKLETELVLHTDKLGSAILNFLPYNEIILSLENLKTSPVFWAAGKIKALSAEPPGSIHIDADVFLKNIALKNLLNFTDSDVLVQHTELLNDVYTNHINVFDYFFKRIPDKIYKPTANHDAYNCGTIGFNNKELKVAYTKNYFEAVSYYSKNTNFMNFAAQNRNQFIPDLILEQLMLGELTYNKKCNVKKILNNPENIYNEAIEIGYTHLIGRSKYEMIDKVKERLFETDKDLYLLAESRVNELVKNKATISNAYKNIW